MSTGTLRERVGDAIRAFEDGPLGVRVAALLKCLGYESERGLETGREDPEVFLDQFARHSDQSMADKQRRLIVETWKSVEIVLQYGEDELAPRIQNDLFGNQRASFDESRIKSFLFLAVELQDGDYARFRLASMVRGINRLFRMPVIVFFRYLRDDRTTALTLAVIHRRAHKLDAERDVLRKATLIKDVRVDGAHSAHVRILGELALSELVLAHRNFDELHRAWQQVLDTEELNKRFYKRLYKWFEQAVRDCSFPDDGAGAGNTERHVIRMITRLLFIWFLKEKRLVPEELFSEEFAKQTLTNHGPEHTDYYRAVLQNLFFATLNTELEKRAFSAKTRETHRDFTKYRYRDFLCDPEGFRELLGTVPFVNGGLFDCLDTFRHTGGKGRRVDAFTDNIDHPDHGGPLSVPARLFFDPRTGLFPILRRYKFTVEENTPLDEEVALDPELLGRAFENLLAAYNPETREHARKATGSYYTPRQVVDYMVDEALVAHLVANVQPYDGDPEWLEKRVRHLVRLDQGEGTLNLKLRPGRRPGSNEDHLIHQSEIDLLVRAIDDLRVLDPACGSGAFPMGILHKLVAVLRKIDPRNEKWKRRQLEAAEAIQDPQARASAMRAIEFAFSEERAYGDFGRKLYLIQRVIHGVDIQPVATQIAKLRFFISLMVEQPSTPDPGHNYGLEPLPNLETSFVAANSLLGLDRPRQAKLRNPEVLRLEERIKQLRLQWFDAHDRDAKWELRKEDEVIRSDLREALIADRWSKAAASALSTWRPYDQNASAGWFDAEWMFGAKDGFDVIIGNPPYVRADFPDPAHRELRQRVMDSGRYETLWEKWDLYIPFIEQGFRLLKEGGVITFIVSDAYCHAKYAEKSQEWFLRHARIPRLDFLSRIRIFDAAVRNVTFVFQKLEGSENRPQRRLHDGEFGSVELLTTDEQRRLTHRAFFPEDAVEHRFSQPTVTLDQICYVSVGMVAHADEKRVPGAFQLADLVSDAADAKHPKAFVEGKHLARWVPATRRWLEWGTKRAPALFRRPTFEQLYEVPEKLIAQRSPGPDPATSFDADGLRFPESVVGFVPWHSLRGVRNRSIKRQTRYRDEKPPRPDLPRREELEETSARFSVKFLLGIMNSATARALLRANRRSNIHLYPNDWKKLSVPDCSEEAQVPVVRLVDAILTAKRSDPSADVRHLEAEVDRLVCDLYGLDAGQDTAMEESSDA